MTGAADASSISRGTSLARRSSTWTTTSRHLRGFAVGTRCPMPAISPQPLPRAGIGAGVFVVAYGLMGGAERLWWLLRHFGHDDCAVIDFEAWLGPLTARRRGGRARFLRAEAALRRHDRSGRARGASRRARRRRRALRRALQRRAEPGRQGARPHPGRYQRTVERAGARATRGRARRLLRLRRHVVRHGASTRPCRPRREALPRLVERVGAARRPPGRARLGGRALEIGQILAPAVRDLRRGEADEEHRLRRPRRPLELHRGLLE